MGQTLTYGIFLPNEGERNCYSGLAANWRAIDGLIGGYNVHVADAVIHVTQNDRDKWDAVTGKANDTDVMHLTGNERSSGNKTFEGEIISNSSILISNGSDFITGTKDKKLTDKNNFNILNERITYNNSRNVRYTWTIYNKDPNGNLISSGVQLAISPAGQAYFYPINDNDILFGASTAYIKGIYTKLINSLTPSSLSLPSYTAPRVDISGYITDLTGVGNDYIAPANGFIFVRSSDCTYINLIEYPSGVNSSVCSPSAEDLGTFIPVNKDRKCIIQIKCTSINRAYFIPCAGNI